jgi:hypothetical protein
VLTVLLLMPLVSSSAFATTVPPFTLSESSNKLQYVLPAGTTFNGSISTTGSVRFWVNAPNFVQVVNLGIIDKSATFSFVAQQNGTYTFNFENDMPNSIQVTFSYVTNPEIPGNNATGISLSSPLIITIIIAAVGSVLIFFVIRRKSKLALRVYNTTASKTTEHRLDIQSKNQS